MTGRRFRFPLPPAFELRDRSLDALVCRVSETRIWPPDNTDNTGNVRCSRRLKRA